MSRPVHYVPSGGGDAFECFRAEARISLEETGKLRKERKARYGAGDWTSKTPRQKNPFPRRSTNLRSVTCRACWIEIARMAKARLS